MTTTLAEATWNGLPTWNTGGNVADLLTFPRAAS